MITIIPAFATISNKIPSFMITKFLAFSQLVHVVGHDRHFMFQVFTFSYCKDQLLHFTSCIHGVSWHGLPVVKHTLWERLSARVLPEFGHEAKRFGNRQMSFHLYQWRAFSRVFLEDTSSTLVHARVHTAHRVLWACDFHQ